MALCTRMSIPANFFAVAVTRSTTPSGLLMSLSQAAMSAHSARSSLTASSPQPIVLALEPISKLPEEDEEAR